MPEINRQKPLGQTTTKSQSVLDRIQPIKSRLDSLAVCLYGDPGTGKTRLACTFPKPLLIIGAEDGTASVIGSKDTYFVRLNRTAEMMDIVNGPVAAGDYKTVVVDNGTKLRDMRIAEILGMMDGQTTKSVDHKGFGFASRDQWGECAISLKAMFRPLFDLRRKNPKQNLVIIAHEQDHTKESNGGDSLNPNVGMAMGKALCDWVGAECDYVGQMLIRKQTRKVTRKVGTRDVDSWEDTGKKEYCLRVGPHEVYKVKFRIGLVTALPTDVDFIPNPTYEKILALVEGRYKEEK